MRKLGHPERLVYCCPQLTSAAFRGLPGRDGGAGLTGNLGGRDLAEAMVQQAVDRALAAQPEARVAVLADGPYGVPRIEALSGLVGGAGGACVGGFC